MPISPTGTDREKRRGFTLIELMVVLVIIVIISGGVVVAMAPTLNEARLRTGCRMVLGAVNYARSRAVTGRTETRVVLDREGQGVSVEQMDEESGEMRPLETASGRRKSLPDGVSIEAVEKGYGTEEGDWITFTPLGRAEPSAVVLRDRTERALTVVVDGVTGRARLEMGDDTEEMLPGTRSETR